MEPLEERLALSVAPVLNPIADVTMDSGTAYYIDLEALDADVAPDGSGEKLTYSVSVDNAQLETWIPASEDNRSLRINVSSPGNSISGSMEFKLFEEIAPLATQRIITLANEDFYDGVIFHRVIDDFMIQGGDPTGTGSGGSDKGDYDDQFSPWGMHTTPGLLSMAKSNDDTNDSQFFITKVPTRWLDFNHTVFGKLTAGDAIREAISEVAVDSNDKPTSTVTMTSVEVFTDYEDGVLVLKAPDGFTGDVEVTVTVDDGNGGTAQRTFTVTVQADTEASDPYLDDIAPIETTAGASATVMLPAVDVDGGGFYFDFQVWPENAAITAQIDHATGELNVTVGEEVAGIHSIFVGVRQDDGASWDTQLVPIFATPAPPASVTVSSAPGDPVTFLVEGVVDGATVAVFEGAEMLGEGTASGATVTIADTSGLAEGLHLLTARQGFSETAMVGNNEYTNVFESGLSGEYLVIVGTPAPLLTVTTLDDAVDLEDGETSLREAIAYASLPGDDTITFAAALFASGQGVLELSGGEIVLRDAAHGTLAIQGPGADLLTIDGGGASGVFVVGEGVVAGFAGMTIAGGFASDGGAILNDGGVVALDSMLLAGNNAPYGGAVSNVGGTLAVVNSTLRGNSATYGGGILNDSGTLILNNVRFEGNTASYGGGVFSYAGTATLVNAIVVGNTAQFGGGVIVDSGTMTISSSTIAANAASTSGGGLLNSNGTLTATNSIVALNTAVTSLPDLYGDLSAQSESNLIQTDPLFAANPSPGGDGAWGTADDDYGDLRLSVGSPAVNAGKNDLLPADASDLDGDGDTAEPLPLDAFGGARIAGGTADIGAAEFFIEPTGDFNADGNVGAADLDIVRANWGRQVTAWDLTQGDASGDGVVNAADLDIVRANWGRMAPAAAFAEPATAMERPFVEESADSRQAVYALAEAAWAEAVDALKAKTAGNQDRAAAVDWVLTEMQAKRL